MLSGLFFIIATTLAIFSAIKFQQKVLDFMTLLRKENKILTQEISKLQCLVDLLGAGTCHPMSKILYGKLRVMSYETFPHSKGEMSKTIREACDEHFQSLHVSLSKTIEKTDDPNHKKFLESKLQNLTDLKNVIDTVDENSSQEYLAIVINQINDTVKELFTASEETDGF